MSEQRTVGGPGSIEEAVRELAERVLPGARSVEVRALAPDSGSDGGGTTKAAGYGEPLRITVHGPGGPRTVVLHTCSANDFGHDRRADRAAEQLLAYDVFPRIPRQARALDVGAIGADGRLISLADAGELYLVTEWVDGEPYATDLRRLSRTGELTGRDLARVDRLAAYLGELHAQPGARPQAYVRAIRDLVGSGEGLFGIVDGYPPDTPAAPPERLHAIEARMLEWRWRLRGRTARLRRTHGDFHPFNLVFDELNELRVLDASRGGEGDPADDVAALAINFPFFALDEPRAWAGALGPLWRRFLAGYLEVSGDAGLYDVIAPFFAWRGLVAANPQFYPSLGARERDRLLRFVEQALQQPRFDPESVERVFA